MKRAFPGGLKCLRRGNEEKHLTGYIGQSFTQLDKKRAEIYTVGLDDYRFLPASLTFRHPSNLCMCLRLLMVFPHSLIFLTLGLAFVLWNT